MNFITSIKTKMQYLGNKDILESHKIGFLCSRKVPSVVILKTYDWAIEQREKGNCIISGFHSKIEKDVFHYLLKGTQPIILVLARGMKKRWEIEIAEALQKNRLLIISSFSEKVKRPTINSAIKRNKLILDLSDEVFVPYQADSGMIKTILLNTSKAVNTF